MRIIGHAPRSRASAWPKVHVTKPYIESRIDVSIVVLRSFQDLLLHHDSVGPTNRSCCGVVWRISRHLRQHSCPRVHLDFNLIRRFKNTNEQASHRKAYGNALTLSFENVQRFLDLSLHPSPLDGRCGAAPHSFCGPSTFESSLAALSSVCTLAEFVA